MSNTVVTFRPPVAEIPERPRKRSVCPSCGPSFTWERPTADTLQLVLTMHHVNGTCDPVGWRGVWVRMLARLGL